MNFGIGLCGAHRTGKSSLAKLYAKTYGINYVETTVSSIIKDMGYNPNVQYDIVTRIKIQEEVMTKTVSLWETQKSPFITDRTPIDMIGYMIANATQDELTHDNDGQFQNYIDRCKEVTNKYFNTVFLIPPVIPVVHTEGKANTTKTYIGHIAYVISGFVDLHKNEMPKVKFDTLPTHAVSYNQRLAYVHYKRS